MRVAENKSLDDLIDEIDLQGKGERGEMDRWNGAKGEQIIQYPSRVESNRIESLRYATKK